MEHLVLITNGPVTWEDGAFAGNNYVNGSNDYSLWVNSILAHVPPLNFGSLQAGSVQTVPEPGPLAAPRNLPCVRAGRMSFS